MELDEIQRKIKDWTDQQRSQNEDDVELTNIENLLNRLQDQGLTNNEIRLVDM